ncbi:MAG: LamG-like jellyroll fold domain-containing protein [Bacteroidota bacterium]
MPRLTLLLAVLAALLPAAHAQMTPATPPLARSVPSDQPFASAWFPNTILDWSPETDPDAPYNRSAVPLASRFAVPGLQANGNARLGEAGINPLSVFAPTSGNPSQGSLDASYYAFSYWPYVEVLIFWGGSASEGLILAPNPGVTDTAHRHGIPVLGTVFFPPTVFGGQIQWVRDFVQRDGDAFPVADKLIEAAAYYGFDGWFINQETAGGNAALATDLQDLMIYLQDNSDLQIEWYDAMTESGSIFWQEQLNAQNDAFFQQGEVRVSDYMFLDFGWTANDLASSNAYATSLGRDPYELFAGVDYGARGLGIASSMPRIFPDGEAHRTSLGIFRPDETLVPNLDNFYEAERALWVGADGDPSREDAGNWKGIAHYIPAATSIDALPFGTHFNVGQGLGYFLGGEDIAAPAWQADGWNNLALQDLAPTWRWWVETAGTPVTVRYDFDTAYQGGSSLRLAGDVAAEQTVRLFQTDLDLTGSSTLEVAYRVDAAGPVALAAGLTFADDLGGVATLALGPAASAGWNVETLDLSGFGGRSLAGLSLVVPASAGSGFEVHVGKLAVYDADPAPAPPSGVTVERRVDETADEITLRLRWTASPDADAVHHYEVLRRLPGGEPEFIGGAAGTAYFVPSLRRVDGQAEIPVEVVAVSPTGARSAPATLTVNSFDLPGVASAPNPADGAANVPTNTRLAWTPGGGAVSHVVYFGTTSTPPQVAETDDPLYDPGPLDPETTYFWRADEVNPAGTTEGPVWSFTTGTGASAGAALLFDGEDDFVDLGSGAALSVTGTQITLEARINPTAWRDQPFQGSVLNKEQAGGAGNDEGYALRVGGNGRANLLLGNGSWQELTTPNGTLALNVWQHVAATYDGATMRIYVDGAEVAARSLSHSITANDFALRVGSSENSPERTFPGGIDEVRVWNVARTPEQIAASQETVDPASEGLVGYWRFDEGAGQAVSDATGNADPGTLGASDAFGSDDPAWTLFAVDAEDGAPGLPTAYALDAAYPNPFRTATTVRFTLPEPGTVRLTLFDLLGRRIAVLADGAMPAGRHTVRLDGARLPSGVYLVRMEAGPFSASRRVVLTR